MPTTLPTKGHYLELIRNGRKTSTIRLTTRLRSGDLVTFTNYRTSVLARCTHIARVPVRALTEQDAQRDGFACLADLLTALRMHYPTLTADASVWVIRFVVIDSDHNADASA